MVEKKLQWNSDCRLLAKIRRSGKWAVCNETTRKRKIRTQRIIKKKFELTVVAQIRISVYIRYEIRQRTCTENGVRVSFGIRKPEWHRHRVFSGKNFRFQMAVSQCRAVLIRFITIRMYCCEWHASLAEHCVQRKTIQHIDRRISNPNKVRK